MRANPYSDTLGKMCGYTVCFTETFHAVIVERNIQIERNGAILNILDYNDNFYLLKQDL